MVDYWAVLGLERGAGPDNVKAAYRSLQKTYHPDSPMVRVLLPVSVLHADWGLRARDAGPTSSLRQPLVLCIVHR